MASAGKALPSVSHLNSIDDAGKWLWGFLKTELAPYPGRAWVVGRVTIAATLVMLVVMTFQIPNGFLGAIFTLFLSRENPTATFVAGLKAIAAFMLATVYTLIGAAMFVDDPLTHFLGVGVSLFVSFFLISVTNDYGTAVAFGFCRPTNRIATRLSIRVASDCARLRFAPKAANRSTNLPAAFRRMADVSSTRHANTTTGLDTTRCFSPIPTDLNSKSYTIPIPIRRCHRKAPAITVHWRGTQSMSPGLVQVNPSFEGSIGGVVANLAV